MLPNWLYGKSKSKLQEILGGGGGGGASYTAGDGIDISSGVISFDPSTTPVIDPSKINGLNDDLAAFTPKTAITNPNLLDNPWFTVNQRGQSSYTAAGYTVDRWRTVNSVGTMTVNVGGNGQLEITVSSDVNDNAFIEQTAFGGGNDLYGKVVTLSLHDGNKIYSITGQIPSTRTSSWQSIGYLTTDDNVTCEYLLPPSSITISGQVVIRVPKDGVARTIRAVKLELGSISTLAMDAAPNYATELLKCQRYFYKTLQFNNNGTIMSPNQCVAVATTQLQGIKFPTQMRDNPSITINEVVEFDSSTPITGVTAQWVTKEGITIFSITGATVGSLYVVDFEASAEL